MSAPSAEQRIKVQVREALMLARFGRPASRPEDVICCGHVLDAHDDDGCTVGWQHPEGQSGDDCPCRVRGWAK